MPSAPSNATSPTGPAPAAAWASDTRSTTACAALSISYSKLVAAGGRVGWNVSFPLSPPCVRARACV